MSERLLKALMQLFAIVADVEEIAKNSRAVVELFLKQQLSQEMVEEYLKIYDEYFEQHHKLSEKKDGARKRASLSSVKILRICTQINTELTQKQKLVVILRLIEYVSSGAETMSEQELEFVSTVAETFNISKPEFTDCISLIQSRIETIPDSDKFLIVNNQKEINGSNKHIYSETIDGTILVLNLKSVNMFVIKYFGSSEIYLNGQLMRSDNTVSILTPGSSIRSSKLNPIYYSDIIGRFLSDKTAAKIVFTADQITFKFKGGKTGLYPLTISEESGKLLGVMGGSGAGKSTLLNVLNGNNPPSTGRISVNNIDIHSGSDKMDGVIGYVSQDDLLIEELTVFQNLFYNAKLCFGGMSDKQITKKVLKLLNSLGLYETRNLKVGSPLEKTISGGQRKRLNIALELIREPSVLFVDEPTSGLSSRDSENIMDLLKELALKGKVVFVVIHQPSSDIFKMFDKLLILDLGGYPIYWGNPVDAIIYFKTLINHVNCNESECAACGNVNPEQIFNIIESKVLDEFGNITDHRKVSPKEWNELYNEKISKNTKVITETTDIPKITFSIPGKLAQLKVFLTRDILSKLTNKQYLFINLLEAPGLAMLLAFLIKFYNTDITNLDQGYIFRENENLVAYLFMAVIVSLFIGLMVSAEEIIRDQKIRKRESFLNLSNGSYLASKIMIMFFLSLIQSLTFLLIGNLMLGVKGMLLDYWLVLFSTACFANMLGLNLSATLNSAVTIYIIIPLLLIPQLLLSGVIVKFEKLNPWITSQSYVPIWGDVMASRWAFEALAVNQFKENDFEEVFYDIDKRMSIANFKKNYWVSQVRGKVANLESNITKEDKKEQNELDLIVLRNEIGKELEKNPEVEFKYLDKLASVETLDAKVLNACKSYLEQINRHYMRMYNKAFDERDVIIGKRQKTDEDKAAFLELKDDYENESLANLVKNKNELNMIQEVEGHLIQRTEPIFLDPAGFKAHFLAPRKKVLGTYVDTYWVNIGVLWFMSIMLIVTLYMDFFKNLMRWTDIAMSSIKFKKK